LKKITLLAYQSFLEHMASPLHVRSSHLALGKRASTRSSIPLSAVSKAQVPIREAKREDLPRIRQAILKEK
jgi:hypothetical protein